MQCFPGLFCENLFSVAVNVETSFGIAFIHCLQSWAMSMLEILRQAQCEVFIEMQSFSV